MRAVILYPYDSQLRPGVMGADFESDNPNQNFTMRFDETDAEVLMKHAREYLGLDPREDKR